MKALSVVMAGAMTLGCVLPANAETPGYDGIQGRGAGRSPAAILDEIDAVLKTANQQMGGYTVTTTKKTDRAADERWQGQFQNWNAQLANLAKEFYRCVDADVEARRTSRDQEFRSAMNGAYETYRAAFGVGAKDPSNRFNQVVDKADGAQYDLEVAKKGFDKTVRLAGGAFSKVRSASDYQTNWGEADIAYAMGLLPKDLLLDINRSIQCSYFLGYALKWHQQDPNKVLISGLYLDWGNVTYQYRISDYDYYNYLYKSNYLYGVTSNNIAASQPRRAVGPETIAKMEQALAQAEAAMGEADGFRTKYAGRLGSGKRGAMTVDIKKKPADEPLVSEYEAIKNRFTAAMNSAKTYLNEYLSQFPGVATGDLNKSIQGAFDGYRNNFVYPDLDQLASRYESLAGQAKMYKLQRQGFAAIDKDLSLSPWYGRPRRELYSAQRVVDLLPGDMLSYMQKRRESAFRYGVWAAEAEFQNAQNYKYGDMREPGSYTYQSTTTTGGTGAVSTTGQSDWGQKPTNTGTTGGDWGTKPATTTGQSDWGSTPKPAATPTTPKRSDW